MDKSKRQNSSLGLSNVFLLSHGLFPSASPTSSSSYHCHKFIERRNVLEESPRPHRWNWSNPTPPVCFRAEALPYDKCNSFPPILPGPIFTTTSNPCIFQYHLLILRILRKSSKFLNILVSTDPRILRKLFKFV